MTIINSVLNLDLAELIRAVGYLGLFGIVFAESGLLFGFFLPGDSLLFTAGFLASQNYLSVVPLMLIVFIAAVLGDSVGYYFGRKVGYRIFIREDSLFFHKDHLERARVFYERFGGRAIILARFMPVVRTFAPILAGVGNMAYGNFVFYNVVGGFLWAAGLVFLGYLLGNTVPNVDRYLLPIILGIIIASISPTIIHILKNREDRKRLLAILKNIFKIKKSSHEKNN